MELDDLDVPMMSEDFTFEESDVLTDEQLAYIKSAAEPEQDAQPENVSSLNARKEKLEQAEMMTAYGLDFVEKKIDDVLGGFQWDETQKALSVKAIAPAFAKSRGEMPEWVKEYILPYKEELAALGAVVGLGASVWFAYKKKENQPEHKEPTSPEQEVFHDAA